MLRWLTAFCILASPLAARDIPIRSGEHESFSRLVLVIGETVGWEIVRADSGFELRLDDPTTVFRTGSVFNRIPQTRLADLVDLGGGRLALTLSCEGCGVDAFLWRPGELVLDITNEPAMLSQRHEWSRVLPLITPRQKSNLPIPTRRFEFQENEPGAEPELVSVSALSQGIAHAVAQGLLSPSVNPIPHLSNQTTPESSAALAEEPPAVPPEDTVYQPAPEESFSPGISVGTVFDRDLSALGLALSNATPDPCLPETAFAVSDWASAAPFSDQIAELRTGLAEEFDETSSEAVIRLARGYVYFGFGLEALTVLKSLGSASPEAEVLTELARIVESQDGPFPTLASQASCDNGAAPWVALSGEAPLDKLDENRVIRQFLLLPSPLKSHLAVPMTLALINAERLDAAETVLQTVDGKDAGASAAANEARAALASAAGLTTDALRLLEANAVDHSRATPEALVQLIDLSLEQGALPDESVLLLLAAKRQEMRGHPVEATLADAELRGWAALGDFSTAFDLLKRYERELGAERVKERASQIAIQLTASADDLTFLDFAFSPPRFPDTPEAENALSRRLLDLGFPDRALSVLSGPAAREQMAERRYLRAEATLALARYDEALLHLQGLSTPRAEDLRARALLGVGDYRGALSVSPLAEDPVSEFRAQAWDRLSLNGDAVLSEVANDALETLSATDLQGISDRQLALDEAQATRARVEALLARFPLDSTGEVGPTN